MSAISANISLVSEEVSLEALAWTESLGAVIDTTVGALETEVQMYPSDYRPPRYSSDPNVNVSAAREAHGDLTTVRIFDERMSWWLFELTCVGCCTRHHTAFAALSLNRSYLDEVSMADVSQSFFSLIFSPGGDAFDHSCGACVAGVQGSSPWAHSKYAGPSANGGE